MGSSHRYRCLVVDHDDTSVMSTPGIHYPAHVEALRRLRPGKEPVSLELWLRKNFDPGLIPFLSEELGWSRAEIEASYHVWREFTSARVPEFFPGLLEIFAEHKARGGMLVVVSHSEAEMIERDYRSAGHRALGGDLLLPDRIFGWDDDPERRKPHPYPLVETMASLGFEPDELLVVDDLKPGAVMAAAAGVDFAAAGWGHSIPEIREAMNGICRYYLESSEDLRGILFA
jgi:beta-phosphoglucomutase-like phosphatase (HAD superfamily)